VESLANFEGLISMEHKDRLVIDRVKNLVTNNLFLNWCCIYHPCGGVNRGQIVQKVLKNTTNKWVMFIELQFNPQCEVKQAMEDVI
jgi:hypothetical protein